MAPRLASQLLLAVLAVCATAVDACAQVLEDRLERGQAVNRAWRLEGTGGWVQTGTGLHALSLTGSGDDSGMWVRSVGGLAPGATYRLEFVARVLPGSGTSIVTAGLEACNRDFTVDEQWRPYSFSFTTPRTDPQRLLHLGQWHLSGTVQFRRVALWAVDTVHRAAGTGVLGEGERLDAGTYTFSAPLGGAGSNGARPLERHTAPFNSNRWLFPVGADVVYRHALPGRTFRSASVSLAVNYHEAGTCVLEARTEGAKWTRVGHLTGTGTMDVLLPGALFPARSVRLRLSSEPVAGRAALQVDRYTFRADTVGGVRGRGSVAGSTVYLRTLARSQDVNARVEAIGGRGEPERLRIALRPGARATGAVSTVVTVRQPGRPAVAFTNVQRVASGRATVQTVPYHVAHPGPATIDVIATLGAGRRRHVVYAATTDIHVAEIYAANYGSLLTRAAEGDWWWCEGTRKVGRARPAPIGVLPALNSPGTGIRVEAAGRERVAAQLVLRAGATPGAWQVSASALKGHGGRSIPATAVRFRDVHYVPVAIPTDGIGVADDWPDPLPPLATRWAPRPGCNNPIWITVTVPPGTPAGDYDGWVTARGGRTLRIPLRVHVWGFSLPERTALRSGFGVLPSMIARYGNLQGADLARQWDLYMRSFAERRLCVYNPMTLAPIGISVVAGHDGPDLRMDFAAFDEAARTYLDGMGFNSFVIGFQGLGGGRHPDYDHGSFLGYADGTPEYERLMTQYGRALRDHLEQHGWLDKAYVYWYDEPEVKDYAFVRKGMEKLRRYAPGLKRMLTEEFRPELFGSVDLWCPNTPAYAAAGAAPRQRLGEEVWWYVCTGPKEPWPGLFIDHPATELRVWLWQTWKHRIKGILIWETTWWTSGAQFADNAVQDPWTDPMAYTSEKSGTWGNGDGRFYYPPNRRPNTDRSSPMVAEPIPSLRWEVLAEGVQDWDYFHMLQGLVDAATPSGRDGAAVRRAAALLKVPAAVTQDMTRFTSDAGPIYAHRRKLAQAIERLSRWR